MTFTWPDTLIDIAVIAILSLVLRGVLKRLINRWVKMSNRPKDQGENLSQRAAAALSKAGSFDNNRQIHRTRTLATMLSSMLDALIGLVAVGNFGWAAACAALLASGLFAVTALGMAWVIAQAVTVVLLAEAQWMGLRATRAPRPVLA